jgi:long-chain fatty acid transport protein
VFYESTAHRLADHRPVARVTAIATLCLLAGAGNASADGWKIQLQGVKALGLGYAGRAHAEDAATVWFNPAGMSQLDTPWAVTFGGVWIPFGLDYTDAGSRSLLGQPLNGETTRDGGKNSPWPVPHFYVVNKVGSSWWAGFGFNAPHGLSDDYGTTWVGRYHATESTLRVINLNPTVAYKANERLSVGAGVDIQWSKATLANRIDFGSLGAFAGLPLVPQSHDGAIELNAGDWAFGFDLSAVWQVTSASRIAATYRSEVEHTLRGTAEFEVPASAGFFRAGGLFTETPVTAVLPMPHELSLSTAIDLTADRRWLLVADFTWTDWSRFRELTVSFDNPDQPPITQAARYEDSWRGAVGAIWRLTDSWTLRMGGLYEDIPVPDATRTPRLPEADNVGITLGGSYRLRPAWDLDFAWSHLIPHDAGIGLTDPSSGTLNGTVEWTTNAIAVGISHRFDKLWPWGRP